MMLILVVLVVAYLIGSFPTAYFVVKRISNIDIRSAGSGNVGGLNTYEVSGSRGPARWWLPLIFSKEPW